MLLDSSDLPFTYITKSRSIGDFSWSSFALISIFSPVSTTIGSSEIITFPAELNLDVYFYCCMMQAIISLKTNQ
jgi:hypothetical protein